MRNLDFVAHEADIVGYSFVQPVADMDRLADELEGRSTGKLGRIAKIETRRMRAHQHKKSAPLRALHW